MQAYGHMVMGAAKTYKNQCRANLARCTGIRDGDGCTTTTTRLNFAHGKYANETPDPAVVMPKEQLITWFELWDRSSKAQRIRITKAWFKCSHRLIHHHNRWSIATAGLVNRVVVFVQGMESTSIA